jgi:hypothetical protein
MAAHPLIHLGILLLKQIIPSEVLSRFLNFAAEALAGKSGVKGIRA